MILRGTIFPDLSGATAQPFESDWMSLCEWIANAPEYPSKADCPLLKLATFGDVRSPRGSLRHDANVQAVWGLEGDHDAGTMEPADAAERLRTRGITSVVYTSASHSPDAPRWRVLVPLSQEHRPAARRELTERLNGLLDGALSSESFNLSQAFYCGRVQGVIYAVY